MSQAIPIYRERTERGERETFYVPFFQVKIEGHHLPKDVVQDVMQLTYRDKLEEVDSFELTVNNWDALEQRFKYEPPIAPRQSGPAAQGPAVNVRELFMPGKRVDVTMGYLNHQRRMLVGEITTLQPNFPETGSPTLTVGGLNILHGLRKAQHTYSWAKPEEWTDSAIARWMGQQPVSKTAPGLGIPVETPNASEEMPEEFVFMQNQYDIVFLLQRARRRGYDLRLELERDAQGNERPAKLIFGRAESQKAVTYELEWGKTLVSFRPTLQTANQVSSVTVRGWDRRAKAPIEGKAEFVTDASCNADWSTRIARAINGREEVVEMPVFTQREAEDQAKRILQDQARRLITAQGATVGLPDLRAGSTIVVLGFGARRTGESVSTQSAGMFDGRYFITETTHTINDQGYRTTFSARRTGDLS
ncbi:MAG: phage late control D family protein [Chloroflexi bacterium]|nr:phage late control D family protein [Chloroflexota bacterium]